MINYRFIYVLQIIYTCNCNKKDIIHFIFFVCTVHWRQSGKSYLCVTPLFYVLIKRIFISCTWSDQYNVLEHCFWFLASDCWWAQTQTTVVRPCIQYDRSPVSFLYVRTCTAIWTMVWFFSDNVHVLTVDGSLMAVGQNMTQTMPRILQTTRSGSSFQNAYNNKIPLINSIKWTRDFQFGLYKTGLLGNPSTYNYLI